MRIHYLMHVPYEGLGNMETWFAGRAHALRRTRLYAEEPLPDPESFDWLVVMGGPMGVYEEDRYPWLKDEKRFIEQAIERDVPVLGVCLGAQLIAEVLGAQVTKNPQREIGWFPVEMTQAGLQTPVFAGLPQTFTPLHWHGDTFSLPDGAVHVARSAACENQAFVYNDKVVGLQFHLEAQPSMTEDFCRADADQLVPEEYVQAAEVITEEPSRYSTIFPIMNKVLERLRPYIPER